MFSLRSSIVNNSTARTDYDSKTTVKKKEKEKKRKRRKNKKKRSGVKLSNPEREESNRFNGPDPSLARQACK